MTVQDQTDVLRFLNDPASYGEQAVPITTTTTHISVIFFAGQRVFKLKRAVHLPYVDFSTAAQRLAACRQEWRLNQRTAPMLYVGVRSISREADGRLVFDGQGELVDAVVEMARFDENMLFDKMAARGQLTPALLTDLARNVAYFHMGAEVGRKRAGAASIASVLDTNERALATTSVFPAGTVFALTTGLRSAFHRHELLLNARADAGKVRRCHGDLHLRNICLIRGVPTLFDCLEFDENMATVDVLYDIAFLLMDLWHQGLQSSANLVFNRYLDECNEIEGLPLMPFFMAMRASIRAHVIAAQAGQTPSAFQEELISEAKAYAALAVRFLAPAPTRLVVIGGLSGTGKSTIAAAVANRIGPAPGARVLASDRIRKRFYGVNAEVRLPALAYCPEVSEHVYTALVQQTQTVLGAGHAVVADAVFDRGEWRERVERMARDAKVPLTGIWLYAPPATLFTRVDARHGDASDATVDVVRAQLANQNGPIDWIWIDAGQAVAAIAARVVEAAEASPAPTEEGVRHESTINFTFHPSLS